MICGKGLMLIGFCAFHVEGSTMERCSYSKESANMCSASYTHITSAADCDEAALSLDLPARESLTLSNKNVLPQGCYFMISTSQLYFNPGGSDSANDTDRVSICASKACFTSSVSSARMLSRLNGTGNGTGNNTGNGTDNPQASCDSAMNLALLVSPYEGSTVGAPNHITGVCGAGAEVVFYHDVAPGFIFTIQQVENNYDSMHALRVGGACPGSRRISCFDYPDTQPVSFVNSDSYSQRVYFIIDAYYISGQGDFTIKWSYSEACTYVGQCGSSKWCNLDATAVGADGVGACVNETGYYLQTDALSCEGGMSTISTREDCEAAATQLGYSWQSSAINYALFPPGCMAVLPTGNVETYYVYFNDHYSGEVHPNCGIMCVQDNPAPEPTPAPTYPRRRRRYQAPPRRRAPTPPTQPPTPPPSAPCDTLDTGKSKAWCKKNCRNMNKCHKLCGRKCNEGCECNSAMPSPSPSPTFFPEPSPSPSPTADVECEDDKKWFFKDNKNKKRKCNYVAKEKNKKKKKQYCNKKGKDKSGNTVKGRVACPEACGTCPDDDQGTDCEDDEDWHVKNKPNQDCDWVSKNDNRCKKKDEDGTKAMDACPVACDTCDGRRLTIV